MNNEMTRSAVSRLIEIKTTIEQLNLEKGQLEGILLQRCQEDLKDTKLKSVTYLGDGGKATATMASSLKITYPSYLKKIFGDAYEDAITVDTKYKLSAPATRMLIGLWRGDYIQSSIEEIVAQLPCDDKAKALLVKKLKGINYDTDVKNLMAIGGLSPADASDTAYFVAEAAVWQNFQRLMKVNELDGDQATQLILSLIDGAVVVEETPKISLEVS